MPHHGAAVPLAWFQSLKGAQPCEDLGDVPDQVVDHPGRVHDQQLAAMPAGLGWSRGAAGPGRAMLTGPPRAGLSQSRAAEGLLGSLIPRLHHGDTTVVRLARRPRAGLACWQRDGRIQRPLT